MEENQNTNEQPQPQEGIPAEVQQTTEEVTPETLAPVTTEAKEETPTLSTQPQTSNIEPQTINHKQETAEMEVHKHPHHVMHKKKWNEYLLEFFMLFLAVFLGFVAENMRENSVEREREKQYMESFVADLQNDTATLIAGFRLKDQRIEAIDSVFLFFESHHDAKTVPGIVFRYMYRTIWDRHYRRNSTTIDQLKNAGGLRLIRKKVVVDSIAAYDLKWERAEFWRESYISNFMKAKDMLHKIFNANDLLFYYRTGAAGTTLQAPITDSITSINIHSADLNEYLNFLHDQKITTTQDENAYKQLMESAARLIALIKKEYHLE